MSSQQRRSHPPKPIGTITVKKSILVSPAARTPDVPPIEMQPGLELIAHPIIPAAPAVQPDRQTTNSKDAIMTSNATAIANSTDRAPHTAAPSSLQFASISPIPAGLTTVGVLEVALLPHVRNSLTSLALRGGIELGLPFPSDMPMISVYAGNPRRIEQAKVLLSAAVTDAVSVGHDYKLIGSRDRFDWFSDGGLLTLLPILEGANGWVTIEQQIDGPVTSSMAEGIFRVRQAAQNKGIRVMLFLVCPNGFAASGIQTLSDEAIEVASCEPDPTDEFAFSIDCLGLRDLHGLGLGKTMCSVRVSDGAIRYLFEPFVAPDLETRMMWVLRGQGKSLAEIGAMLKRNKTTVLRRLTGLPAPRRVKLPDDWLDAYLDWIPVAESSDNHNRDGSGAGDDTRTRAKS